MDSVTRIKVCGITRLEDAQQAQALGVDAIGFVFCAASKRAITPAAAASIAAELAPFVVRVGLFLNATDAEVRAGLDAIPNLLPQFHGTESAAWCDSFGRPYLKAMGVANGLPTAAELSAYRLAQGFLFDSHAPGELGGTGETFDWSLLGEQAAARLILAGGLDAKNVCAAVRQVKPYAVDVSSGVEKSKGVKDVAKLKAFVTAVRRADEAIA